MKNSRNTARNAERGSIFFVIFLGILLLGALTWAVAQSSEQQATIPEMAQLDDQISRLTAQAAVLAGAMQQMVLNGGDPAALAGATAATGLNTITPGGTPPAGFAAWDTSPHNYKIYHPYGGGIKHMVATGPTNDTSTIANNFQIRKGSIVKGVGATDTVGDIVFTARVTSLAACQRINQKLRGLAGTATPPTVTDDASTFDYLFVNTDGTTNGTIDDTTGGAGTCAACINIPQSCVKNTAGNKWGYYQVLMPN